MTKDDIARLRALAAAATPGPWDHEINGEGEWVAHKLPEMDDVAVVQCAKDRGGCHCFDDAAFIAAARDALPAALDEVERLRAALQCAVYAAWDGPPEAVGTGCEETYSQWRNRMEAIARRALAGGQ